MNPFRLSPLMLSSCLNNHMPNSGEWDPGPGDNTGQAPVPHQGLNTGHTGPVSAGRALLR